MGEWMKCLSPQNTFGVSGVKRVEAKSNTIEGLLINVSKILKQEKETSASILLQWYHPSVQKPQN